MTRGKVERPDFRTASDQEIARYHRACLMWADEKGLDDAELELRRRGRDDLADYLRKDRL